MIEGLQLLVAVGIFGWMIRIERRLTAIETTCGLRNAAGKRCTDAV